ncbi:MAG: hypothetical protein SF052_20730 [Bacteroidia bacterium]|nr:hypothetical protein [Bacteroidia bacterium]
MMKYTISFDRPKEKLVKVEIETAVNKGTVQFFLPKWRPGRYELQAYPKNVSDVTAKDRAGNPIPIEKVSTHVWEAVSTEETVLTIRYFYFANVADAGGSWFDEDRIYVNGINLFMYRPEAVEQPCELTILLPEGYELAGGFSGEGPVYRLENFHQLVDTPFLAGKNLIHHRFEIASVPTHLWFQGECKPDLVKMETDIRRYTEAQMAVFGDFPVNEYHYLYVMLPGHFRHGVEHHNSTVIAMGPGHQLMTPGMYKSWLEISSHELFHTWNVKALRPADMFPYNYDTENYSKLHYITEGVTTYYGDLMIWKGGIWDIHQWINSINAEVATHYRMGGKAHISLEEASFQSWVNGYQKTGTPNRRISFYTKGYLVSMLIDAEIRRATDNRHSLDDVMREMYHTIAKQNRGYTARDYREIIETFSRQDFGSFFEKYISGTHPLEHALVRLGEFMGLDLFMVQPDDLCEASWGLKITLNPQGDTLVENLLPDSPLRVAGLSEEDEIISINGIKVEGNLNDLIRYFSTSDAEEIEIHYFHLNRLCTGKIATKAGFYHLIPQFALTNSPTETQQKNRNLWQKIRVGEKMKNV